VVNTFRIGTTSYVYPADIITNVRKLAGRVSDIELVLFESDEQGDNLDSQAVEELCELRSAHLMSFTVHLPLDLDLAGKKPKLKNALRVIKKTAILYPHGYIVHLDGQADPGSRNFNRWLENSWDSLKTLIEETGDPRSICVENLENHSPQMLDSLLDGSPVAACVDVGHLWKQNLDPLPFLAKWLSRTRVVHLHGVGIRDHQRLSLMARDQLDPVVSLLDTRFNGVVTFEIFSDSDLVDSMNAFNDSLKRTRLEP
jgi:sugar phosphate isomerase/epimerase